MHYYVGGHVLQHLLPLPINLTQAAGAVEPPLLGLASASLASVLVPLRLTLEVGESERWGSSSRALIQ